MLAARTLVFFALCAVVALFASSEASPASRVLTRHRRQLADDDSLQPLEDAGDDEQTREKRKLEGVTQAKFGIKNAVLGFVFGSGTTSRRRALSTNSQSWSSLTRRKRTTEHQSLSRSSQLTSISQNSQYTSLSQNSQSLNPRERRQATDDIPEFDRNKVSLDLPGNLFGPSVSLLIRTTKIIGDVIQNSAERYRTFLRLFRPLFRGQFEIKGLDPPTTTTTTTTPRPVTTSTTAPASDNEVRRR